jgi:uncharacterized protein YggE
MWINQAITRPFGITAFGSSLVRAEPDLVLIELGVTRLAGQPQESFHATHAATAAVRTVLREAGVPDTAVETSRVILEMSYEHYPKHQFLGYEAKVGLRILLDDLDALERLLNDVVEAGAHQIDTVRYQTRRLKELRAQARHQAVESARVKAAGYADAAQVHLGSVVHIEDVNPDQLTNRGHAPDIDATENDENAVVGALESGSITVTAAVMVSFAILPGGEAR